MINNNTFLLLLSLLMAHSVWANSDEDTLLRSVMPTACHFSGEFIQDKKIQGLPMPLVSEGDFFFSCELGMVWQTQQPFGEALIYSNYYNYRVVSENKTIEKLTSLTHYGMSKIMLKMLNGDVDYFAESFSVALLSKNTLSLIPESQFMKKAIDQITLQKIQADGSVSLKVSIDDKAQQKTVIMIDKLVEYDLETKQAVQQQCEQRYPNQKNVCEVLRFPARFNE